MKFFKINLAIGFALISAFTYSQNWTGNINSDWNNPANWTSWPLSNEDLLIDTLNYTGAKASPVISTASVFSPAGIVIQNGAHLTVNNNISANDRIEVIGEGTSVVQNAGTFHAAGSGSSGRFIASEGASVLLNGGSIVCEQRLIIELGATFVMNGGIVTSIDEIAIGDGNLSGSSLFLMNGGSVIAGGGLGFENELGDYEPTFRVTSGSLSINGDVSWLGVAPGEGTPRLILQGGTSVLNGSVLNSAGSTVDLYLSISDSANVTFNGPAIGLVNSTDSIVHIHPSVFTIRNTNTITNAGVWFEHNSLVTFDGNTTIAGGGEYRFNDVLIGSNKFLSQVAPAIKVCGNITNNGILNTGIGSVKLDGAVLQSVSGLNAITFYNLDVDNSSAGILLNQSVIVNHRMEFNRGLIATDVQNLVIIADNAIVSNFSDSSFVSGPMLKRGNDSFVFPVGKADKLAEIGISAALDGNAAFLAEYFGFGFFDTSMNPPLSNVSSREYWNLQQTTGSDSIIITLVWDDSTSIQSCDDLTIATWNGSAWNNLPAGLNGTCSSGSLVSQASHFADGALTFGNASLVTSVNEDINGEAVIYPNPTESLSVLTIKSKTEIRYVEIFDGQGRMVRSYEYKGSSEVCLKNIGLSPGLYYINIFSGEEKNSSKLLVN
jgi:hypothetical protein